MSVENDFLPFAAEPGANVIDQTDYASSGFQTVGQQPGIVLSENMNKVWRQGSMGMAVLAAFIVAQLGQAVLDSAANGAALVSQLLSQFQAALTSFMAQATTPTIVTNIGSNGTTPVFNCALGNPIHCVFEMGLTGNVTSSTLTNAQPGMLITFILKQDAVGGRTFVWPSVCQDYGEPNATANAISRQTYIVDTGSLLQAIGGMIG